jgi:hypothetical protein
LISKGHTNLGIKYRCPNPECARLFFLKGTEWREAVKQGIPPLKLYNQTSLYECPMPNCTGKVQELSKGEEKFECLECGKHFMVEDCKDGKKWFRIDFPPLDSKDSPTLSSK